MIELIERTLLNGGDLEEAKQVLLNQVNVERLQRNNAIEHDYRIAVLLKETMLTEPKGSIGYSVAKGVFNRLSEKYRNPANERIARKLRKEVKKIDSNGTKEENGKETIVNSSD